MDTDKLKYFCAIVELGSFTQASKMLGISHSGLSKAMGKLEEQMQLELFVAAGRGVRVTDVGSEFYQKSLEILKLVQGLDQNKKTNLSYKKVRIALTESLAVCCSHLIANEFSRDDVILFKSFKVGELEKEILGGNIDFGLAFTPKPVKGIEYLSLKKVVFNSYARSDLIRNSFKIKKKIPFAVSDSLFPDNPLGHGLQDVWPKHLEEAREDLREYCFEVSSLSIGLNLLKAGLCALYIPDYVAKAENDYLQGNRKLEVIAGLKKYRTQKELFLVKAIDSVESIEMKKVCKVIRKL